MWSVHNIKYMVAIPIPSLDRSGTPLSESEMEFWKMKIMDELRDCFGGATPVPAPGTNAVEGADGLPRNLYEAGQVLVLSGCETREDFMKRRARVRRLAEEMGKALRQAAVFVLACPSDSFLLVDDIATGASEVDHGKKS